MREPSTALFRRAFALVLIMHVMLTNFGATWVFRLRIEPKTTLVSPQSEALVRSIILATEVRLAGAVSYRHWKGFHEALMVTQHGPAGRVPSRAADRHDCSAADGTALRRRYCSAPTTNFLLSPVFGNQEPHRRSEPWPLTVREAPR
jgi:hypothetical protein